MTPTIPRRPPEEAAPRKELRGVVERLTYQNPENGYTVARLAPERPQDEARAAQADDRLVTIVGTLADLTPGEAIVAQGWWRNDPKHGWQFQVLDYRTSLPATTQWMRRYLGSGLVKGVGPVMTGRIVDAFGDDTFDVIDATPGAADRGRRHRHGPRHAHRRDLGGAAPHPRGDGRVAGLRRLHLARGADLQALRRR